MWSESYDRLWQAHLVDAAGLPSVAGLDPVASSFVFAFAGSLWLAILGSYGIFVTRQVAAPLFMAWLNRSVEDSAVRATTLSIVNQADAVGQWTGGPAIGALGTVTSIRVALAAATACLLPALGFLRTATRHDARDPIALPEPSRGTEW